jgi:dihydropteroate synthase
VAGVTRALHCGSYALPLERPLVMGIVNVTPDSFSDGGRHADAPAAVAHARTLLDEGADLIDIGGESTRPGAPAVTLEEERRRVLPVIEALAGCGVPVSVDTRKPQLMKEALAAGASMVNDVNALRAPGALEAVAATRASVCLMHMRGDPATMQDHPLYDDVVAEVRAFLQARIEAAEHAGIERSRIIIDPGFGFGKNVEHNLMLLRHLDEIAALGVPVLVGLSRKSTLGKITGRATDERAYAGVAAALIAVQNGARIVRVHDVAATRDALAVLNAVRNIR